MGGWGGVIASHNLVGRREWGILKPLVTQMDKGEGSLVLISLIYFGNHGLRLCNNLTNQSVAIVAQTFSVSPLAVSPGGLFVIDGVGADAA